MERIEYRGLAMLVALVLAGCSNGLARVQGTVTLNGEAIERGSITLEPADGRGAPAGANIEGGKYTVDNVQPGAKKVQFFAVKLVGQVRLDSGDPNSPLVDSHEELLGPEFNSNSSYTLDVKAPVTTQDFPLETSQKK